MTRYKCAPIVSGLAMFLIHPLPIAGQTVVPKVVIATDDRTVVLDALKAEAEAVNLHFVKAGSSSALFTQDAGQMPLRGQMARVRLETTFHFEDAKPGTRLVVTEELIATLSAGFEDRRHPNPRDRVQAYQDLLDRTKERVEGSPAP